MLYMHAPFHIALASHPHATPQCLPYLSNILFLNIRVSTEDKSAISKYRSAGKQLQVDSTKTFQNHFLQISRALNDSSIQIFDKQIWINVLNNNSTVHEIDRTLTVHEMKNLRGSLGFSSPQSTFFNRLITSR